MVNSNTYRHMKSPHGFGEMQDADAVGLSGRPDRVGPFFCVFLKLDGLRVQEMRYVTFRCPWAIAAGSVMSEIADGKDLAALEIIREKDLQQELGDVPSNKFECLSMAIAALRDSLTKVEAFPKV